MKMAEIRASQKDVLTPADVAEVLGCGQYGINIQAQQCPERLGFPVVMIGNRVKIPRLAFIHWMDYGRAIPEKVLEAYEREKEGA